MDEVASKAGECEYVGRSGLVHDAAPVHADFQSLLVLCPHDTPTLVTARRQSEAVVDSVPSTHPRARPLPRQVSAASQEEAFVSHTHAGHDGRPRKSTTLDH